MYKLDVIIPCYNAYKTIDRCLCSIACQTMAKDILVTLVDDCSTEGRYDHYERKYHGIIDIRVLRLEQNAGPGVARQYGIDHTSAPYFTCIDADDTYAGAYALCMLVDTIEADERNVMCVGEFEEELPDGTFKRHSNDLVWMFGKVYRRSYIDTQKVRFHPTSRYNEDNGFNTTLRLITDADHRIVYIKDNVYYWQKNDTSITRVNNNQYTYDQCFVGYVDNQVYAVNAARRCKPFNGDIEMWCIQVFCYLYAYFAETVQRAPERIEQNWQACQKFYDDVFAEILPKIPNELMCEVYSGVMGVATQRMAGVVPEMTFWQFIDHLKRHDCVGKAASA